MTAPGLSRPGGQPGPPAAAAGWRAPLIAEVGRSSRNAGRLRYRGRAESVPGSRSSPGKRRSTTPPRPSVGTCPSSRPRGSTAATRRRMGATVTESGRDLDPAQRRELEAATAAFMSVRPRLFGIAYRMLSSATEAEDLVQEVWLRWQTCDRAAVANPAAFLATTTTRLAINALQSARVRRETYIGPWLPEPVDSPRRRADPAAGRRDHRSRPGRGGGGREGPERRPRPGRVAVAMTSGRAAGTAPHGAVPAGARCGSARVSRPGRSGRCRVSPRRR